MKRLTAALLTALVAAVPAGFLLAAIWAAETYSYSEKLADTGVLLMFGIPIICGLAALIYTAPIFDSKDSR